MKSSERRTPRDLGYRMPAEWEKHDATWLAWPYDPVTFPERVEKVERIYVQIISALLPGEEVELVVRDRPEGARISAMLQAEGVELDHLRLHYYDYADVWFRDYGPIFVKNRRTGEVAMTKWGYNAWGGKYESLLKDDRVPHFMHQEGRGDLFETGWILEGGSIDVNGKGTLLTTESCLLNPNRNPKLGKQEIETLLADFLDAPHVIWLREGIAGDDTDGHVDDLARFVNPTTVLCANEEDPADPNHSLLAVNQRLLSEATDQDGNRLRVVKLPMPGPVGNEDGRLPASYANFYIGNRVVLVPVFGHPNDARALGILREQFPGREIVGIPCNDLVYGLGAIHCISQQQPSSDVPG